MPGKPKKSPREKDLTARYLSGGLDEDHVRQDERFNPRSKVQQQEKTARTALMRAAEESGADIDTLPIGQVVQVHSLFSDVEHDGVRFRCVVRRTLTKVSDAYIVVGDRVRFRDTARRDQAGAAGGDQNAPSDGVIEQVLPRRTVLTRADSFKGLVQHPIVANAERMLIVVSLREPRVKWGLVDRMIVAARAGGLEPIVCLNKIDLAPSTPPPPLRSSQADLLTISDKPDDLQLAEQVLAHYATLGIITLRASVPRQVGLETLRELLKDQTTVLAGHSGVGKSSLIRAIQPSLDIRIAEVSRFNDKGRHTTTSAKRYPLDFGGAVIDTPGVKMFGLWGVTRSNLATYFPDVATNTAPLWRRESYDRIAATLDAGEMEE